jgi:hypothetical protein
LHQAIPGVEDQSPTCFIRRHVAVGVIAEALFSLFFPIVDQRWLVTSTGVATDRFAYGYDRDSNRLYRDNKVNSAFGELYHANGATNGYDNLGQARGVQASDGGDFVLLVETARLGCAVGRDAAPIAQRIQGPALAVGRSRDRVGDAIRVGVRQNAARESGQLCVPFFASALFCPVFNSLRCSPVFLEYVFVDVGVPKDSFL